MRGNYRYNNYNRRGFRPRKNNNYREKREEQNKENGEENAWKKNKWINKMITKHIKNQEDTEDGTEGECHKWPRHLAKTFLECSTKIEFDGYFRS